MKKNLKIVLALVCVIVVFVFKSIINYSGNVSNVSFTVNPGDNFLKIASNLKKEGIIENKNLFVVVSYFSGDYSNIKPGDYVFDGNYTMRGILDVLKNNRGILVVIPEGYNIFQVENELIKKGIINNKFDLVNYTVGDLGDKIKKYPFLKNVDLKDNLEGFLYPNSYFFLKNMEVGEVVNVFLNHFGKEIYDKVVGDMGEDDFYNKLIIASMAEKEVYHRNDISKVVSVIENRMENNMLLQIDATLCYIKMKNSYLKGEEIDCGELVNVDKKLESLYNTYMVKGMIPGPICNVNYDTFKEVLVNIDTDYFYYITDPKTKNAIFAKNLEGHNINIQKYLK